MWHGDFPLGTFVVNIVGCFIIGLLMGLLEKTDILTADHSVLLVTGFCGGFTTFSAFADDMFRLGERGNWGIMTMYLALSVIIGILLVWAGRAIVR